MSLNVEEITISKNLKPVSEYFDGNKEIMVSVFCLTYNQEKYIRSALDSFLNQLVDFNVEIVIHDDASEDSTPNILKEYATKYPHIVKVFFEKENQYSKVGDTIEIERVHIRNVRGKYIASCEGDDYWIDKYKLYLQVHALENNQNCNFCVHRVKIQNLMTGDKTSILPSIEINESIIESKKFIDLLNCDYPFQTSCYFMRTNLYKQFLDEYPLYAQIMPTSDEAIMYYLGDRGNVFFINRVMSCWRKFTENSWNETNLIKSTSAERNIRRKKFAQGLMEYYHFTKEKYPSCLERRNRFLIQSYLSEGKLKEIFKDKLVCKTLKKQGLKRYFKLKIKSIFQGSK